MYAGVPGKGSADLNLSRHGGDGEKWSDWGLILKAGPVGFGDSLDMEHKRKRGSR